MPSSRKKTAAAPGDNVKPPTRIVAIGASAGGLEAFSALLRALPVNLPMAFLLIQHLDPKRRSMLPELLSRTTPIPVQEVKQGTTVEAGRVYVMPSDCDITLRDGHFVLIPRTTRREIHMPINIFMCSLAEKAGSRAVGVVLSGTGSDGTEGLTAIRAAGGVTIAQDPKTAKFDTMPKSAMDAGCVDTVLSPEKIARELGRIGHALEPRKRRRATPGPAPAAVATSAPPASGSEIEPVLALLRSARGCDFTQYKPNTLRRRTQQRMSSLRIESHQQYRKYLEKHPEEIDKLCSYLLIPVTQFFRDREVYAALRKTVFPAIVGENSAKGHIRVWVPACSSGEEAYSLAISLLEFLGAKASGFRIQIFGSDINPSGIAKARAGVYPAAIAEQVSEERLQRFFTKVENGYRVSPMVRELCVFARQDIASDPPFSNLDIISCRNLLIYLEPELQRKILSILHYSLRPHGFLLLGQSESADSHPQLFTPVDKKARIYAKRITAHGMKHDLWRSSDVTGHAAASASTARAPSRKHDGHSEAHLQGAVDRLVLSKYAPPGVLVNDSLEILQFRGRTSPFIDPASGRASFNLLKMVREDLALALRAAVAAAKKKREPVRKSDVPFERHGKRRTVNLTVVPIEEPSSSAERFYLILFEESTSPKIPSLKVSQGAAPRSAEATRLSAGLKRDLTAARAMLRDNMATQDALREDYQSANEELLSANEELQSTNEELETSKEELQSANEELTTVNDELSSANFELNVLSNDLTNLLDSTIIPMVMVDRDLSIRRVTPAAGKVFKLLPHDVGRRITDMWPGLDVDLKPLLLTVIHDVVSIDREVRDRHGCWYRLQLKPYKTADGKINGAILALIDIDAIKKSNERLKLAGEFTASIIETVPEPVLVLTTELRVKAANQAFYKLFHLSPKKTLHEFIYNLDGGWDVEEIRGLLEKIPAERAEVPNYEIVHEFPGHGERLFGAVARYMVRGLDAEPLILLSFADLTQRKKAEAALIQSEKLSITGRLAASIAHEINNPLEALTNLIYLASIEKDYESCLAHIRQAQEQLQRVSHITQQTLRFHRQASGPTTVRLHEVLDSVLDLFRGKMIEHRISLEKRYNNEPPATLHTADIRQVLANLIGNAIEAMPSGGRLVVRVRASRDWRDGNRAGVRITIADSGAGMTRQVRRRIYEPFFTNKEGGTGLGMWISSQLIDRHQGDIRVWSTLRNGSSGTAFSLFLPLAPSAKKPEALAQAITAISTQ